MKNDTFCTDGGGRLEGLHSVAFGKTAGGLPGIGKFVGIGMGPREFDRDGAEVMESLDAGRTGLAVGGKDAGPKAEAGVVTEFDRGKTEGGSLLQERGAVGNAVGMPAGGQGEVRHRGIFQPTLRKGDAKASRASAKILPWGLNVAAGGGKIIPYGGEKNSV